LRRDRESLPQVMSEIATGDQLRASDGQRASTLPTGFERYPEEGRIQIQVNLIAARPNTVSGVIGTAVVIDDAVHATEAVDHVVVSLLTLHEAEQCFRALAQFFLVAGLERPQIAFGCMKQNAD